MIPDALVRRATLDEVDAKRRRLLALARDHGYDGAVVLRRHDVLGWLLGGADTLVSRQGAPVAQAVAHEGGVVVVTNRIEAERLAREELPAGVEVDAVPWEVPTALGERALALARELGRGAPAVDDGTLDPTTARWPLLPVELERYRAAGGVTARALTDVAHALTPETTEHAAAALLIAALRPYGLHVPVALVAGASRLGHVRHPVPTHAPLGGAALLVVCSEARGLVSAASRLVTFGAEPGPVGARLEQVLEVERAMLDACRPGASVASVFAAARRAYADVGYPDAWRDHHQGGPIGYRPREWIATPDDERPVAAGAAYAWNPSLPWAKSEDTFVIGDDGAENLTADPRWPSRDVGGRARADVLRR